MSLTAEIDTGASFGCRPEKVIELSMEQMYAIPLEEQKAIQLEGARLRFDTLVSAIPVLTRLAAEQEITRIRTLDDLGPLLVPHSALKSYPMSYLEKSRFDRLTQWLDGFTTHDLSGLDMSGIESIDDWLDVLDKQSEVRVLHSTGTSGKLSFVPRGTTEMKIMVTGWRRKFDRFRDEPPRMGAPVEKAPTIFVQYRKGGMAQHRLLDYIEEYLYHGDASQIVTTNPTRFSADAASIGGRLRVAQARGELGSIQISPKLMERRDAFLAEQAKAGHYMDAFLNDVNTRFRGKPVAIMAHIPMLFNVATEGLKRGIEGVFARDSFIMAGGGFKGLTLPDHWRETVDRFFGGAPLSDGYGMTELVASTRACPEGRYHIPAWEIPFILDPKTGEQAPRTGTVTGRFGFFDLNAQTYWGGFLTGDEVTFSWGDEGTECACGRIGPYVHRGIRRYSESEGGDDKVTCAGAPDAHDKAIEFILQQIG
ncbi:MAG TPA: hypothetical protein VKS60_18895 [Stellaceae bacterium]|nr:hypothetical protein [Stellaceae bacterium]